MEVQPRYQAYCDSHGFTVEQMLEYDRGRWPGGTMCGYILWINRKWNKFCRKFGVDHNFKTKKDHENFNKWLKFLYSRPIQ